MGKTSFYSLTVSDIIKETADTVSIALSIPQDIKSQFQFIAGQYITFKVDIDGEELRRAYSICSSPSENDIRVAVKKVQSGKFSTYANETLKVGDVIEVMPPMGNFKLSPTAGESYVGIAAGSGITPIMSMIKATLDVGASFVLYYGSKSVKDIIFKEELASLVVASDGKLKVIHVLSREDHQNCDNGRIDKTYVNDKIEATNFTQAFLCGPEEMIHTATDVLVAKGMDKEKINFELFTASTSVDSSPASNGAAAVVEDFDAEITIILDDEEEVITANSNGDSILEVGLKAGLDLPFACKGGVCCTCKAQVKEGEVYMEMNYSLDEDEVKDGYVLACQCKPRSKKVVLDFDV